MTISAEWSKILKTTCPDAYSADNLHRPKAVFIDGQINLMKSDWIVTWDQFVFNQYIRAIDRFFAQGIKVVILGFDDYRFVPGAKNMTQTKRSKCIPKYDFEQGHALPKGLPANWAGAMRNRTFKVKVINLVFETLAKRYETLTNGTLFFDFDKVTRFGNECELPDVFTGERLKRGECDVKAFSWVSFCPLQIESTDGDFIPMSLLQTFKNPETKIILHRMKTKLKDVKKRDSEGVFKREYEFVNISIMYNVLCSGNRPIFHNPMTDPEEPKNNPIEIISTLTSLTGCDFCMNLPKIGPTTIWKYRKLILNADMKNTQGLLTYLIILYREIFKNHLKPQSISEIKSKIERDERGGLHAAVQVYTEVYESLQKSKLSPSVKASLFTPARLLAHVKNVQWTVSYWKDLHFYIEPLEGDFGYVVKSGKKIEYEGL